MGNFSRSDELLILYGDGSIRATGVITAKTPKEIKEEQRKKSQKRLIEKQAFVRMTKKWRSG